MDYVIAIASHDRIDMIQKLTLALLRKHHISMEIVYVFCSPEFERAYRVIGSKWGLNVVLSKNNIKDTRNHIIEYFPEGKRIVEIDDDVREIVRVVPGKRVTPIISMKMLIKQSFNKLLCGEGLWGVNATDNNREGMNRGIDKYGSYSIVNSFCGYVNDKRITLTVDEKEDYDRTAQFVRLDKPVLKRTGYGIRTKYWKNSGGIQSRYDFGKRVGVQKKSANTLIRKFPGYFAARTRNNGIVDIRFRRSIYTRRKKECKK